MSFDDHLKLIYVEQDVPSDELLQDPELGDQFVAKVRAATDTDKDREEILRRVVSLRKQGELPTLR